MKKYLYTVVFVFMILTLSACGAENTKINIEELSADLISNVEFADEMTLINEKTVESLYNINYAISQQVYISSGATAEEVAVFELKDGNDADKALDAVNQRIETQKQDFKTYIPEEIPKLENAIVKKVGQYVIVCISDGDEADEIINSYIE
jgi:hypothetical protein